MKDVRYDRESGIFSTERQLGEFGEANTLEIPHQIIEAAEFDFGEEVHISVKIGDGRVLLESAPEDVGSD